MQEVQLRNPRAGKTLVWLLLIILIGTGVYFWKMQTPEEPTNQGGSGQAGDAGQFSLEDVLAREKTAAFFANDNRQKALNSIQPLLERDTVFVQDMVRGAIVRQSLGQYEAAEELLLQAREQNKLQPSPRAEDAAAIPYNLGQLALSSGDFEAARVYLEEALAADPSDISTRLGLAQTLEDEELERTEELYNSVIAEGFDHAGSFYMAALYRQSRFLFNQDRMDEGELLQKEFTALQSRGFNSPNAEEVARGRLGDLLLPTERVTVRPKLPAAPSALEPVTIASNAAASGQALGFELFDLDNNGEMDLVAWGNRGLSVHLQARDHNTVTFDLMTEAVACAAALDVDNDDGVDLVVASGGKLWLSRATLETPDEPEDEDEELPEPTIAWQASVIELGVDLASGLAAMHPVDFDHDGDLDLALVGDYGLRCLRNDGLGSSEGQWTLIAEDSGADDGATENSGPTDLGSALHFPSQGRLDWIVKEDFDTDQDVDLMVGGASSLSLYSNLRGGRFEADEQRQSHLSSSSSKVHAADFNGDGLPDVLQPTESGLALFLAQPSGAFQRAEVPESWSALDGSMLATADVDLDGSLDLLHYDAGTKTLKGWQSLAKEAKPFELPIEGLGTVTAQQMSITDWDADFQADVIFVTDLGVQRVPLTPPAGQKSMLLSIRGVKDNRRGVGSIVEVRAGTVYQRVYWSGQHRLIGISESEALDWLSITWPNGVLQFDQRLDSGDRRITSDPLGEFLQVEGLVGSCPFLYTWNGETYEFISDVLGITPLGLPMAPGMLVPPDHDEYVLVRGDQMAPKDGLFELQFTEELREVTYLDYLHLEAVDHPEGTEIYPNERFTLPPFPEAHTHTVKDALAPKQAMGSNGKDWTAELSKIDDSYAAPFEVAPSQYLGLATPHFLELSFDPADVADAKLLRLVMTGWFYWSDASVNMASARDPEWNFIPPMLQVPGEGPDEWITAGPPIGFPAGKTKTMVIDVSEILRRDDPRLRVFCGLRLYWDSIRLATDNDDAELSTNTLSVQDAHLWLRGFSEPSDSEGEHQPVRFDWERVSVFPRWDPHPGLYTRLGAVEPLLEEVDDQFIIMGAGEALKVTFDATQLPPVPEGFVRDYLIYMDGWAKDRDPNTIDALHVKPYPFHGMSGYPYGANESFPDTAEHRQWEREWNTRIGQPWRPQRRPKLSVQR